MPTPPDSILLREFTSADRASVPAAIALLNRTQGVGLFPDAYLDGKFDHPDARIFAAFAGPSLVGLGVVQLIRDFSYYMPFADLAPELSTKRVASFSTLAVDEAHQGRGLGQRLSELRIAWAEAQQCDVVIGVSWVSGLRYTSRSTFERCGFRAVGRVDDFYVDGSRHAPFDCPGCRRMPCRCAAVLYRRDLR